MDIWNQLSVYAVLEQLGFYLPFPPCPVADRQRQGRDDALLRGLARASDPDDPHRDRPRPQQAPLRDRDHRPHLPGDRQARRLVRRRRGQHRAQLRGRARGGQPGAGRRHHDGRAALLGRRHDRLPRLRRRRRAVRHDAADAAQPGSPVSNAEPRRRHGVPADRRPSWSRPRRTSPKKLPDVPFFCVDFLYDGERYWFSELEPDGVIVAPSWPIPTAPSSGTSRAPAGPPTATPTPELPGGTPMKEHDVLLPLSDDAARPALHVARATSKRLRVRAGVRRPVRRASTPIAGLDDVVALPVMDKDDLNLALSAPRTARPRPAPPGCSRAAAARARPRSATPRPAST